MIFLLILLNGIFSMAEIAIISSRRSRLQQRASDGDKGAISAMELVGNPNRFLSTVQLGITLISIIAGAFGGATLAHALSVRMKTIWVLAPVSDGLSLAVVVSVITYVTLVLGELVPKRLGLAFPDRIASIVSRPMETLARISGPAVSLLGFSTDRIMRLLPVRLPREPQVSEEEVRMLISEGARTGVFDIAEKDIFERTLMLGDRKVGAIMTPKSEIVFLDADASFSSAKRTIRNALHSQYPVRGNDPEDIVGILKSADILGAVLRNKTMDIRRVMGPTQFVPESMDGLDVLEVFRLSGIRMALVVDEYGSVQGLVTLADILEVIVGNMPQAGERGERDVIRRDGKSWFVEGLMPIEKFKEYFRLKHIAGEKSGQFNTMGGFAMREIGRMPKTGDSFDSGGIKYEVVDMDGHRIDKLLVTKP